MRRMIGLPTLFTVAVTVGSCEPRSTLVWDGAVRDSAGIEIVENIAPMWIEGEEWRLSEEPVLTIGVLEGPFDDGCFLGQGYTSGTEGEGGEGTRRSAAVFVRWSRIGELIDTLVLRPGVERLYETVAGQPVMASPPFPRNFSAVVSADGWYYASSDEFEIEQYWADGRLRR